MIAKEKGVSPVIAEILLVSITIILVASVYIMVTNGIIGTPYGTNQLNGSLIINYGKSNATLIYCRIILNHPQSTYPDEVKITISSSNSKMAYLTYSGNFIWSNKTSNGKWHYEAKLIDNDGDGKFSNEDSLIIYIVKDASSAKPPEFENGYRIMFSIDTYEGVSAGGVINF